MKVAFRCDASLWMGTGHVMRCLTLADALKERGAQCMFISREHSGHLIEHIQARGHGTRALPLSLPTRDHTARERWLGATQDGDAKASAKALNLFRPDWVIVDHYALDEAWETAVQAPGRRLMVIDDLADRRHHCDLLLDQTLGRQPDDYRPWLSGEPVLMCGAHHALLRPEFAAERPESLRRRATAEFRHLLITMGGADQENATGRVLQALQHSVLPSATEITVVMGSMAPWLSEIRQQADHMPWRTTVQSGVTDMASLMARSDLAIGAAGTTSWERCCLGLPAVIVVLADNQRLVAHALEGAGAVRTIQFEIDIPARLPALIDATVSSRQGLLEMGRAAARVTDGEGATKIVDLLLH